MIATITLHVMAALLLGLSLLCAMSTGLAIAEDNRKTFAPTAALTLFLAIITFALQVIA